MDETQTDGFRRRPLWLFGVAGLLLAQAGLALALFGPGRSWAAVADGRPVLSGRHPLHQYHGTLGSRTFRHRGATACFDPAFQAGYPKTPVFDGGCRPAELFFLIGGSRPAAYKAGLFACVLLIPLVFVVAARGAGLPPGASVLAGACGLLLAWSGPVRGLIDEGELDFLTAGLAAVVFVTWLARYARQFGVDTCMVLAATAAVGWYAHPVVWLGLLPVVIGYYLVFAPRHGLAWHLGLVGISAVGLAPNLWWLTDWGRYWWLRQPSSSDNIPLPGWQAVLGTPHDYAVLFGCVPLGGLLVLVGLAGLVALWRSGHRGATALLFGVVFLTTAVARLLAAWPRVPPGGPERLVPLTAAFLVLPAAFGLWKLLGRASAAGVATGCAVLALLIVGWVDGPGRPLATAAQLDVEPLAVGFSSEQEVMIAVLREQTTADARILWDETTDHRPGWNWSALLPLLTDRAYLGGLDHDAGIDHSFCGMRDGMLNGRPLATWTDAELAAFSRWYNVGWVVCRSGPAAERWGRFPMARSVARLQEDGISVVMFALDRPRSFVLSGSARWEDASPARVVLSDVVPDANGEVELSLHNLPGLRVYPSYIQLHSAQDVPGGDPINHVKLRMPGPVPRVTLVWENP
ncbi:MAG TPA: hypothetical protein VKE74_31400 [Gemmataceae bacterium]|nr:hypothetical protein [Gemmataceae bacterium]